MYEITFPNEISVMELLQMPHLLEIFLFYVNNFRKFKHIYTSAKNTGSDLPQSFNCIRTEIKEQYTQSNFTKSEIRMHQRMLIMILSFINL